MLSLRQKSSFAVDDRTLKTLRKHSDRLNASVSAVLRILASKLESGGIKQ